MIEIEFAGRRYRRPSVTAWLPVAGLALMLAAGAPAVAGAQTPAASPLASTPSSPVTAGWRDGFYLQSADGAFQLRLGLLGHFDGRFALDDENGGVVNTFAIRRLRPSLRGRLAQRLEFNVVPDFAGGSLAVQDAYIDAVFSPALRVRFGKTKAPFGLERLHSGSGLLFFERGLPTALVPNRDVGVQVLGDLAGGRVSYAAGLLNGVVDGSSADVDTNDAKDLVGRLVVRPFADRSNTPLAGLGLAVAGARGEQSALPSFRTASVLQSFFSYSGASADGDRVRFSPQAFYYHKGFGAFGEYVRSSQPVRRGDVRADIAHDAWQVAVSWVLTGEAATDRGVRPHSDFGPGGRGAVQIAARYYALDVDQAAFTLGLASGSSSRKAEGVTVGVNWYVNPFLKYVVNFERTVFDDGDPGARPAEKAVVVRTQVSF